MKFLVDVCACSSTLLAFLRSHGHDVVAAAVVGAQASDERLMEQALQEERVLVTNDKDFGELIFVRKLPHGPIVRMDELSVDEQVKGITELLQHHQVELTGPVIVTILRGRIRIRRG
jgi:predicted nuclease of predicted toxin-antitoxin system